MNGVTPARRIIRLFPDYGRDWPLWEDSTPSWDVGYTTTPEMYDLSEALTRELVDWNSFWERNFDPFDGWADETARERWRENGVSIAARLRMEVADFADVTYEPWPLDHEQQEQEGSKICGLP